MSVRLQTRFAVQQIVLACMQEQKLDAVTYPTSKPAPTAVGWSESPELERPWCRLDVPRPTGGLLITVPAGFTTKVYDWVRDPSARPAAAALG